MATFNDRLGRTWQIDLDTDAIRQVRKNHGIAFGEVLANEAKLLDLYGDVEKYVDVLFDLCEDQARVKEVDTRGFAKGIDGPTLERSRSALYEAIVNFYQPLIAGEVVAGTRKLIEARVDLAKEKIKLATEKELRTTSSSLTSSPA